MGKIIRSVKALEDLDSIFDFVAASSPQERYIPGTARPADSPAQRS